MPLLNNICRCYTVSIRSEEHGHRGGDGDWERGRGQLHVCVHIHEEIHSRDNSRTSHMVVVHFKHTHNHHLSIAESNERYTAELLFVFDIGVLYFMFTPRGYGASSRKIPPKCEKWCLRIMQEFDVNQFINLDLSNILGGRLKNRWFLDGIIDAIKLSQESKGISYDWLRLAPLIRHSVVSPVTPSYSDDAEYTEAHQSAAAVIFSMIDAQVEQEFKQHQAQLENERLATAAREAVAAVVITDATPDAEALAAGVDPLSAASDTVRAILAPPVVMLGWS